MQRIASLVAVTSFILSAVPLQADLNTGLVAYYPFDGTGNDAGGQGLNSVVSNGSFVPGWIGQGATFIGSLNSYAEVQPNALLSPTSGVSISLWVRVSSFPTAFSCLVYKAASPPTANGFLDRAYTIWARSDKGIHFTSTPVGSSTQSVLNSPPNVLQSNSFTHVVCAVDASARTMKIYIAGALVASAPYGGSSIVAGDFPLRLGTPFFTVGDQSGLAGTLDEVRIYNRALSAQEISSLSQQLATAQPLPAYQHNPADGRQTLRDMKLLSEGQSSLIFSTTELGATCLVSRSSNLLLWSPLIQFTVTTPGTQVVDIARTSGQFYRATYLPLGVSVANAFSYPIGSGDMPEQITPERNNLFPSSPVETDRGASTPGAGWYNVQDVGSYYPALGGIHPGEDWNNGSDSADDIGEPVKAVANGQVIGIKPASSSGAASLGYVVLVRHWLPNGNSVDSLYVHVAPDKIGGSANLSGIIGSEADFTYQQHAAVSKGAVIGVIGNVTDVHPHLHLEMRDTVTSLAQLWPHDTDNGYYGADVGSGGRRSPNISAADVQAAFNLMRKDGIIDPSDFIDDHK